MELATKAQAALEAAEKLHKQGKLKLGVQSDDSPVTQAAKKASGVPNKKYKTTQTYGKSSSKNKKTKKKTEYGTGKVSKKTLEKKAAEANKMPEVQKPVQEVQQPSTPLAKGTVEEEFEKDQSKGLLDLLSVGTGIVGGIAGSALGPAGTVAGAGLGSMFGEWIENIVSGAPVGQNLIKEGVMGAGLTALGLGVFKLAKVGRAAIASKGVSIPIVGKAASGQLTGGALRRATFEASGEYATGFRPMINTRTASKLLSHVSKVAKRPGLIAGILFTGVGAAIGTKGMSLWGDGEALDTYQLTKRDAIKNENYELALAIGEEYKNVVADIEAVGIESWVPVVGTATTLQRKLDATKLQDAASDVEIYKQMGKMQESEQAQVQVNEEREQFLQTGQLSPEKEPKWLVEDGKYRPNKDNPNWVERDGKLVWFGEE